MRMISEIRREHWCSSLMDWSRMTPQFVVSPTGWREVILLDGNLKSSFGGVWMKSKSLVLDMSIRHTSEDESMCFCPQWERSLAENTYNYQRKFIVKFCREEQTPWYKNLEERLGEKLHGEWNIYYEILRMNRIFIWGGKVGRNEENIKEEKMPRAKLWSYVSTGCWGESPDRPCGWSTGYKEWSLMAKAGE